MKNNHKKAAIIIAAISLVLIVCACCILAGLWGGSKSETQTSELSISSSGDASSDTPDVSSTEPNQQSTSANQDTSLNNPSNNTQSQEQSQDKDSNEYSSSSVANNATNEITVSVSIDVSAVSNEGWPSSMGGGSYTLKDGSSAYDALVATGVAITGQPSYVTSIDGLYSGQYGSSSGWMYSVNGQTPMVGADSYALKNGDTVRWYYVRNFG